MRRGRVVAVITFAALIVAAPAIAATSTNANTRALVLLPGDSNVLLSSAGINFAFSTGTHANNGYVATLTTRDGAGIRTYDCLNPSGCATTDYWKIKLGGLLLKMKPDAVVTDLGINDTTGPGTLAQPGYSNYSAKIDWFMHLFPSTTPVFWPNLPCNIEPQSRVTGCRAVNNALAGAPARWANLTIVNWAILANSHPEYLVSNDIHLTPQGQNAWAAVVVKALDAHFAG